MAIILGARQHAVRRVRFEFVFNNDQSNNTYMSTRASPVRIALTIPIVWRLSMLNPPPPSSSAIVLVIMMFVWNTSCASRSKVPKGGGAFLRNFLSKELKRNLQQ